MVTVAPARLEDIARPLHLLDSPPVEGPDSKPQGQAEPLVPVSGRCAWYAADYKDDRTWIHVLTANELEELDVAIKAASALAKPIHEIRREDVELPTLGPILEDIRREVQWGRGFALIKGFPVHKYSRKFVIMGYWIIGRYWGNAVSQNKKGHLVGHVKDIGHDPKNPTTRIYTTRIAQPYHVDSADLVALLCLTTAMEGGESQWASSITAHNEILKMAPELAAVLAGPWMVDRKNEVPAGKLPYFNLPIFNYHKGYLTVQFHDTFYQIAHRHPGVQPLTKKQEAALKLFRDVVSTDRLRMDYILEPGDIQLLNNFNVVHARSAYVDHPDIDKKRHLLRLWFCPDDDRPLPPVYEDSFFDGLEIGNRGGINVPSSEYNRVPLEAE